MNERLTLSLMKSFRPRSSKPFHRYSATSLCCLHEFSRPCRKEWNILTTDSMSMYDIQNIPQHCWALIGQEEKWRMRVCVCERDDITPTFSARMARLSLRVKNPDTGPVWWYLQHRWTDVTHLKYDNVSSSWWRFYRTHSHSGRFAVVTPVVGQVSHVQQVGHRLRLPVEHLLTSRDKRKKRT